MSASARAPSAVHVGTSPGLLRWIAVSGVLLFVGFASVVLGMYGLGVIVAGDEARSLVDRVMTAIYFRVILFKGLLPQLLLALCLWPLLLRVWPAVEEGRAQRIAGLALLAGLAYAVVAPLLLSVELPGWPALQMRSVSHHLGTALLSVAGVVAAALLGHRLLAGRSRATNG